MIKLDTKRYSLSPNGEFMNHFDIRHIGSSAVGGIVGAGVGLCFGGIPGAMAMGSLGATAGMKASAALEIVDRIRRIVTQVQEFMDRSSYYLIGGTTVICLYRTSVQSLDVACYEDPNKPVCQGRDLVNLVTDVARSVGLLQFQEERMLRTLETYEFYRILTKAVD